MSAKRSENVYPTVRAGGLVQYSCQGYPRRESKQCDVGHVDGAGRQDLLTANGATGANGGGSMCPSAPAQAHAWGVDDGGALEALAAPYYCTVTPIRYIFPVY